MTKNEIELEIHKIIESGMYISIFKQYDAERLGQYLSYCCLNDMAQTVDNYSKMSKADFSNLIRRFEPFRRL